jgi:hypothetical protein
LQGHQGPGNVSAGKLGKVFARLKLALIGFVFRIAYCVLRIAGTLFSYLVFRPGGAGKLALIGFVLDNVRCSLFVVLWHKPLFLLYLCSFCPF